MIARNSYVEFRLDKQRLSLRSDRHSTSTLTTRRSSQPSSDKLYASEGSGCFASYSTTHDYQILPRKLGTVADIIAGGNQLYRTKVRRNERESIRILPSQYSSTIDQRNDERSKCPHSSSPPHGETDQRNDERQDAVIHSSSYSREEDQRDNESKKSADSHYLCHQAGEICLLWMVKSSSKQRGGVYIHGQSSYLPYQKAITSSRSILQTPNPQHSSYILISRIRVDNALP